VTSKIGGLRSNHRRQPSVLGPRILLALGLLLAVANNPSHSQIHPDGRDLSRFERTLLFLRSAAPQEQADFAIDALSQLVETYMAEADLARKEAGQQQGAAAARLRGWAVAVDQYASQLLLVLEDVEEGYPVQLLADRTGPLGLHVAGRTVMLGHPRADQQAVYEQLVLAEFCARHDCSGVTAPGAGITEAKPIPVTAARVSPDWTFSGAGSVCRHRGVTVRFDAGGRLGEHRDLCSQLMQELFDLATELSWQQRQGVVVDWDSLEISPTPGRPGHLVRLNAAGDSILVTVPILAASETLLGDSLPWLRAASSGEEAAALQLDASRYGWASGGR
jgi:hypothetical protein